jgi:hypothetical protein
VRLRRRVIMKTKIVCLFLLAAVTTAQTVYEVVPNTKENKIILSVVNESKMLSMEKVNVRLSSNPKGLEVCSPIVEIGKLKNGEEKEALFAFDTKRIPGVKKDTLVFSITDRNGESWKKEVVVEYALPKEFKLEQNYPNPFNPSTTIEFTIPNKGNYILSVYNILGQQVKTLIEGEFEPGYYKTDFIASQFASGIYIYRLNGNGVNISKKMLLVK